MEHPIDPVPGSSNQSTEPKNPYKGTGLETVYANFLAQREYHTTFLGVPFEGTPCLPGCTVLIKRPCHFKKHVLRSHVNELNQATERLV